MRVALAHHWFIDPRGGERVLAQLADIFPDAPILTSVAAIPASWWPAPVAALRKRIVPSRLQGLFQHLVGRKWGEPLLAMTMPIAMSRPFDVDWADFDALLISDAGLAKCIPTPPHVRRFVYLHTPMRFVWHDLQRTVEGFSAPLRPAVRVAAAGLRGLDRRAATRIGSWAANSRITAQRAAAAYRIPVERIRVVPPSIVFPAPAPDLPRRGLLVVSSMQPYKRDDLAVLAATQLGVNLTVAGDGPLRQRLEGLAGRNVTFTGSVTDQELDVLYRSAEALLFCGEEDFGLIPVEAMVRGTPVVAFRAGGALETVTDGVSGMFFDEQTPGSVVRAAQTFFRRSWDRDSVRRSVERFHPEAFERGIREWLAEGTGCRA